MQPAMLARFIVQRSLLGGVSRSVRPTAVVLSRAKTTAKKIATPAPAPTPTVPATTTTTNDAEADADAEDEISIANVELDESMSDTDRQSMRARLKAISIAPENCDPICMVIDQGLFGKRVKRSVDRRVEKPNLSELKESIVKQVRRARRASVGASARTCVFHVTRHEIVFLCCALGVLSANMRIDVCQVCANQVGAQRERVSGRRQARSSAYWYVQT